MKGIKRLSMAATALLVCLALPGTVYGAAVPMAGREAAEPVEEGTGPALETPAEEDPGEVSGSMAEGVGLAEGGVGTEDAGQPGGAVRAEDALAEGPAGTGITQEKQAALEDNWLEYGEIAGRVEHFNKDYRNTKTTIYSMTMSLDAADDLAEEASLLMEDARDLRDDDMDAETRALYEGYKEAARELRRQAQKLTNAELSGTYERTLRQLKNQLTQVVQNLMIQYRTVEAKAAVALKNVEFSQAALQAKQTMAAGGQISAEELLEAEETLRQAESAAAEARLGAETLRTSILLLLGWEMDSPVEFAPIDLSVLAAEDTMDLAADQKAAIGANSGLMAIRSTAAAGSASRAVKKRNAAMTEQSIRIQMEQLYGKRLAERQRFLAAAAEKEAADLSMEAARKKNSLGMMSRLDYLGAELSWLSAQASYTEAAMSRLKAIEDYDWAVKGLITSNES